MVDEKIESARSARDSFIEDLDKLRTYDDFRQFMLRYFSSQTAYEEMDLLISMAELKTVPLVDIPAFKKFFRETAYHEFFRKKDRFTYEEIQLGFMK